MNNYTVPHLKYRPPLQSLAGLVEHPPPYYTILYYMPTAMNNYTIPHLNYRPTSYNPPAGLVERSHTILYYIPTALNNYTIPHLKYRPTPYNPLAGLVGHLSAKHTILQQHPQLLKFQEAPYNPLASLVGLQLAGIVLPAWKSAPPKHSILQQHSQALKFQVVPTPYNPLASPVGHLSAKSDPAEACLPNNSLRSLQHVSWTWTFEPTAFSDHICLLVKSPSELYINIDVSSTRRRMAVRYAIGGWVSLEASPRQWRTTPDNAGQCCATPGQRLRATQGTSASTIYHHSNVIQYSIQIMSFVWFLRNFFPVDAFVLNYDIFSPVGTFVLYCDRVRGTQH